MAQEQKQLLDVLATAISAALSNVHTMAVARVTKVAAKTINCRPVVNRQVGDQSIQLPEFIEVPPITLQGGNSYTAYPITVGDYCLLLFSERCFDRWYGGVDYQSPPELRMHDYSDGFALVGVNPLAAAITIPTVIQQTGDTNQDGDYTHQGDRTQTGNVTHTGDTTQEGNVTHTGNYTITGNMVINGNLTVSGLIVAGAIQTGALAGTGGGALSMTQDINTTGTVTANTDVVGGGKSLATHTHSVTTAPGTTSAPN